MRQVEMPVPFPIRSVNAWLFPGTEPTIVDCGIGTPEAARIVHDALRDEGMDGTGTRLLLTHGHVDHAGNAASLGRMGIRLWAPRSEAPFVETFREDSPERNDRYRDALMRHGMPPEHAHALRARSDGIDAYMHDKRIDHDLTDGQHLLIGDLEATAHHAPGHTPGSTVYLTEDNHLLSGDTLLEHITSNAIELLDEDEGRFHQYVVTIDGLRRFLGTTVLPGHHAPFTLTEEVLEHHLGKHHKRAARILEQLDAPRSAWDLLPRVFGRLQDGQWFLAMSDVVGHLHALEQDGKVRRLDDDGTRRFARA